jgi:putative peptidoglycan lipid II flippase
MSGAARDLARAGMVVTSALFVSRILGWVRVAVIAASLGISRDLDIYIAAFRIPDFIFQLVAAGALASAVIPTIATLVATGERERAWRVVSTIANLLMLVLAAVALITFVAAPALAPFIAPGFGAEDLETLVLLTRILLVSPIFLALSAVATSILNSAGRFSASVMAPIVYNLVIIAAAVTLVPRFGLAGLAWGTVVGAAATVLVQVVPVFRGVGFHYTPAVDLRDREARKTLVLLGPRALGLAGSQLTLLFLTMLGSTLAAGAIGASGRSRTLSASSRSRRSPSASQPARSTNTLRS